MVRRSDIAKEKAKRVKQFEKLRGEGLSKTAAGRVVGRLSLSMGGAGRPKKLGTRHEKQLAALIDKMQKNAGERQEITAKVIYSAWKSKTCSLKTVRRFLRKHYEWKAPSQRAKPKDQHKPARAKVQKDLGKKSAAWWRKVIYIDGHTVHKYASERSQAYALARRIRGQYRKVTQGRKTVPAAGCHVKTNNKFVFNYGGEFPAIYCCDHTRGVSYIHPYGSRSSWTAAEAIRLYEGLAIVYPRGGTILQDNDPVWSKPVVQERAAELRFTVVNTPPMSPDFMIWDQTLNAELDRRILDRCARRSKASSGSRKNMGTEEYRALIRSVATSQAFGEFVRKQIEAQKDRIAQISPDVVQR
jgi:hypothetical protein